MVTDSVEAMAAAVAKTREVVPLLASASADTAEAMAKIAKENNCPLAAKAESIEALADLSEKIKAKGVERYCVKPCPSTSSGR